MTNLTVNDGQTPSQAIIADANRTVVVKDAQGRSFEIRRLTMSSEIRIAKAITADNASKDRYMALVNLSACVVAIDGEPVSPCRSELQFEALLERMGSDGFAAVAQGMRDNFMPPEDSDPGK